MSNIIDPEYPPIVVSHTVEQAYEANQIAIQNAAIEGLDINMFNNQDNSIENITEGINNIDLLTNDERAILIKQKKRIKETFINKYKYKLKAIPKNRLTEYEQAAGFTNESRNGSKQFCVYLGKFMEEVYNTSLYYKKLNQDGEHGSNDGVSKRSYFEAKSRHDTMKQSMAYEEIKSKLEYAISKNKKFKLFILTDKNNIDRDIPLHQGQGLSKIKDIKGYDEEIHRWVSGMNIYNYLFKKNGRKIKTFILELLSSL